MKTRRQGIIAVLATIAAVLMPRQAKAQEPPPAETKDLSSTTTQLVLASPSLYPAEQLRLTLADEDDKSSPWGYSAISGIEVEYKGRHVKISAKEIMDALEGK